MTHLYTIVADATVLADSADAPVSAVAWAFDTVLALGSTDDVLLSSRGDSHVVRLPGTFVMPLGAGDAVTWPPTTALEVGGPADLAVLLDDPRLAGDDSPRRLAVVRGGHVVSGSLGPEHVHQEGH